MALSIEIAGTERAPLMRSLQIGMALNQQTTCEMQFVRTDSWMPVAGNSVEVTWDSELIYSGTVDEVERSKAAEGANYVSIICVDHTAVLGRRLAGEYAWTNTPAGTIIEDITHRSLVDEGFLTTGIETGPTIEAYQTDYQTVAEAFRQVAELAGYVLRITPDQVIQFHAPSSHDADFAITDLSAPVKRLEIKASRDAYANRVIIRLNQALLEGTVDTFTSTGRAGPVPDSAMALDGNRKVFDLSYRAHAVPTIKVNGATKTVIEAGEAGTTDWYWNPNSQRIEQPNPEDPLDPAALTATDTLEVTYAGVARLLAQAQNATAITERQGVDGGSGIYETAKTIEEPITIAEATTLAETLVDRLSALSYVATYETNTYMEPDAATLVPGMRQGITRTSLGSSGNYLIRSVYIGVEFMAGVPELTFQVEAAQGPILQDAVEFFRALSGDTGPAAGLIVGPESPVIDEETVIPTPDQPDTDGWSIDLGPTQADEQTGEQYQRIDVTITARPTGVEYWHVWVFEGASQPTDLSQWGDPFAQHISASGNTVIEFWKPRGLASVTYQVAVTGNTSLRTVFPTIGTTPVKSVVVPAISASTVPATWDITATSNELAGTLYGRYAITATLPSDVNRDYWITERRWTAASWGTPKSDWFPFFSATTLPWQQSENEWKWPDNEWLEIRFGTVNYAGQITWHGTIKQLHLSGGGFIKAGAIDPDTLSGGMAIISNKLASTMREGGLQNGDFSAGLKHWDFDSGFTLETGGDAYAGSALRGAGNGALKYATSAPASVIPGRILRCSLYAVSNLSGGNARIFYRWDDKDGNFLGASATTTISASGSYVEYAMLHVVPANAAFVRFAIEVPAAATSGRICIDNVYLGVEEPLGTELKRVNGQLVIDALSVGKLTAGTAEFSGTVVFKRGTTGGQVTIDANGVTVSKPSGGSVTIGSSNVVIANGSDAITLSTGLIDLNAAFVEGKSCAFNSVHAYIGLTAGKGDGSSNGSLRIYYGTTESLRIDRNGTIETNVPANWRTALGITTAYVNIITGLTSTSLLYKDHSGNNQTQSVITSITAPARYIYVPTT